METARERGAGVGGAVSEVGSPARFEGEGGAVVKAQRAEPSGEAVADDDEDQCAICLSAVPAVGAHVEARELRAVLQPCGHAYHSGCINGTKLVALFRSNASRHEPAFMPCAAIPNGCLRGLVQNGFRRAPVAVPSTAAFQPPSSSMDRSLTRTVLLSLHNVFVLFPNGTHAPSSLCYRTLLIGESAAEGAASVEKPMREQAASSPRRRKRNAQARSAQAEPARVRSWSSLRTQRAGPATAYATRRATVRTPRRKRAKTTASESLDDRRQRLQRERESYHCRSCQTVLDHVHPEHLCDACLANVVRQRLAAAQAKAQHRTAAVADAGRRLSAVRAAPPPPPVRTLVPPPPPSYPPPYSSASRTSRPADPSHHTHKQALSTNVATASQNVASLLNSLTAPAPTRSLAQSTPPNYAPSRPTPRPSPDSKAATSTTTQDAFPNKVCHTVVSVTVLLALALMLFPFAHNWAQLRQMVHTVLAKNGQIDPGQEQRVYRSAYRLGRQRFPSSRELAMLGEDDYLHLVRQAMEERPQRPGLLSSVLRR
ncbi:uncharacterized protein MONBRDRAFT_6586 [Monosiga brevicollis MX1]|uniref:RING-type domain-containing protein n=1 Tax=Monosiga brevicollis TaxID=81824 RepID=A9UUQ1_MONBE|nr:uncharacterized protein MONBRDRAFT_6586 [Monosiga brevicollis MX1]EDQ90761.1 predicted protein [Monosiga brevicollis MX1]|eukprot:XP_001744058.1 hypothetical protein [Monosiga brevicollis MX1]